MQITYEELTARFNQIEQAFGMDNRKAFELAILIAYHAGQEDATKETLIRIEEEMRGGNNGRV